MSGFAITRDRILETARTLPAAPQVLSGLCELLQDVNTDLDHIAEHIRCDPALAARVIRMSNSVVFGRGLRIGSVDEAVNRMGFGEILRLVGAAAVTGMVDRSLVCYGVEVRLLRENLLYHALASEALAQFTEIMPRTAYTAGLLRALGMMVLDRMARDRMEPTEIYDPASFKTYSEWEGRKFGLGSTEVTTMILDEWRFPPESVSAIQDHLLLREASYEDRFACLLNCAGALTAQAGLALPGETKYWELNPKKNAASGWDPDQMQVAAQQTDALFARQRETLI
jgi:HD-like signal output (HDOD) protein